MKMMMRFMKSKSRKRKRPKGEITELQKVLSEGAVLKTHHENVRKYPNIVCKVESFCQVVKHFDPRRRALVTQMGFEGLLEIDMKNAPKQFCYWLMTRVLPEGTMVFGDSEILPLGPAQVRSVLGLPMGAEKVPFDIGENDEEKVEKIRRIFNLYGVDTKKETILLKNASEALCPLDESGKAIPLADEVDEEDFMAAFLLVALIKVVCTTTNNSNFPKSLLPALTVATEASLTLKWLCDMADRFQRKFPKDGFRSGCGGSFLFIMIYYLDHLHRVPVKWGVYPRVKLWNSGEVKATLLEDKVSTNEYGKLLAVDVAYGEEHPLVPRESDGVSEKKAQLSGDRDQASVDDVERVLGHLSTRLETIVEGLLGKALNGLVGNMTNMGADEFVTSGSRHHHENAGSTRPRDEVNPSKKDGALVLIILVII